MSHRGGICLPNKPPPAKKMPGPPGSGQSQSSTGKVSEEPGGRTMEKKPVIIPAAQAMPNPTTMRAMTPPPPPPLPGSGLGGGVVTPTQSEMAQ